MRRFFVLLVALGAAAFVLSWSWRASAANAFTTDCNLNFVSSYQFGGDVCVTGKVEVIKPGNILPDAWLYAVYPNSNPQDPLNVMALHHVTQTSGFGEFFDELVWAGALGGQWEIIVDQYPFIDSVTPFEQGIDLRGVLFNVSGSGPMRDAGADASDGGSHQVPPLVCKNNKPMDAGTCNGNPPTSGGGISIPEQSFTLGPFELKACPDPEEKIKLSVAFKDKYEGHADCPCASLDRNSTSLEVEVELCGRSASIKGGLEGTHEYYKTPTCLNGAWACLDPSCEISSRSGGLEGALKWKWKVGELFPPLAPFINNGIIETDISLGAAIGGTYKVSDTKGQGKIWGCCDTAAGTKTTREIEGFIKGSFAVKASINLGILSGEGSVEGKVCVKPSYEWAVGCGEDNESAWHVKGFLGACLTGQVCVGGGYVKYCVSGNVCPGFAQVGDKSACE